jgi:hypothetical protein
MLSPPSNILYTMHYYWERDMTTVELYDVGTTEPLVTEAADDHRIVDLAEIDESDVLVVVDEADNQVEFVGLDVTLTVGEVANGQKSLSLLRNPTVKVTAHVHYAGDVVDLDVHAATRIRRVRKLAVAAFELDAERAADTSLRLEGSDVDLPLKRPIGAYLVKGQHEITLDLVHKVRPQG